MKDWTEITAEDFRAYEDVRESGVTNMLDLRTVEVLSGLERHKIVTIIQSYDKLADKFLETA